MPSSIDNILKDLKETQSEHRYKHTIGVMYTAASLCMKYGIRPYSGLLAGALHDCAKINQPIDYIKECTQYNIFFGEDEINAPHLLHANLSAYIAENKYFIDDSEILHAISVHTTGCPNMSLLDKIIFVADYIEPGRGDLPNIDYIRKLAFEDITECVIIILKQTLEYLSSKNYYIGKATLGTYKYYTNKDFFTGGSHE